MFDFEIISWETVEFVHNLGHFANQLTTHYHRVCTMDFAYEYIILKGNWIVFLSEIYGDRINRKLDQQQILYSKSAPSPPAASSKVQQFLSYYI